MALRLRGFRVEHSMDVQSGERVERHGAAFVEQGAALPWRNVRVSENTYDDPFAVGVIEVELQATSADAAREMVTDSVENGFPRHGWGTFLAGVTKCEAINER